MDRSTLNRICRNGGRRGTSMIVRLIAATITPIVSKSRFLRVRGARAMVSNQPYLELQAPARHQCRTTLIVKQGTHGLPVYRRAQIGYLHVDFKVKTWKQAHRQSPALPTTPANRHASPGRGNTRHHECPYPEDQAQMSIGRRGIDCRENAGRWVLQTSSSS